MNVTNTVAIKDKLTLREALLSGVDRLQERLQGSTTASRDAQLLLMRAADCDRVALLTHPDREISSAEFACYNAFLSRRAAAEPIQYILGEQEFFGLRFEVTADVLIPRPETEHLVEALLALFPQDVWHNKRLRIADVGTGSGAIAVALAHSRPQAHVTALDNSPAALLVARRNAEANNVGARIEFLESDLLDAVRHLPLYHDSLYDAIVSNPPYVAYGEVLEAEVRDYEPAAALFAGPTGLEVMERLIPQAKALPKPGGWLLLEIGAGQQPALERLLSGWGEISFVHDLQSIARVAIARR